MSAVETCTRTWSDCTHTFTPSRIVLPWQVRESIDRYAEQGMPTGGFLRAVLERDLFALGMADAHNAKHMLDILAYLHNEVPSLCWGSPAKVAAWLKSHQRAAIGAGGLMR